MPLLLRKPGCLLFGALIASLIASGIPASTVNAQTAPAPAPATPPAVAPTPRLKLTAEQEYIIRENLLKDANVPKQSAVSETIGDTVPDNIKLYPLPPEVTQKVPDAKAHQFVVKDANTVVLVSPSDRRVADVIKKKSTD